MSNITEKCLIIAACVALLLTLFAKGKVGWRYDGKPAIAQTGEEQAKQDASVVEDSGCMNDPVSPHIFANTRWCPHGLSDMPAPLRQVTRGGPVTAEINRGD